MERDSDVVSSLREILRRAMGQTSMVEVNGRRARVRVEGHGALVVVVLHGWGGRIESMTPALSCLSEVFRTIAIDLPGFGESPAPDGAWGTPDYASFVRDLLAELGVGRAHFLGHSFGAKVAFYLAATYPELVDKLILIGSPGLRTPPSIATRAKVGLSKAARAVGHLGPPGRRVKGAVYGLIASQDYKDAGPLRPIMVRVVNEDFAELLPRIDAPTLLIWGEADDAAPLTHAERMAELIPDAGLVVFEGSGHFAYLDEPVRFCRVARHFFGVPL